MTDSEYDDLFNDVLKRMRDEYPSRSNSHSSVNEASYPEELVNHGGSVMVS